MEQLNVFRQLRERLSVEPVGSCGGLLGTSSSQLCISTAVVDSHERNKRNTYSICYSALLTRKTVLTHLQLLLSSTEVSENVNFAYEECKKNCMAVRNFNIKHSQMFKPQYHGRRSLQFLGAKKLLITNKSDAFKKILYGDIMDIFIKARSRIITETLIKDSSAESTLRLADFENSFIMAFTGIVATYTHTLDAQNNKPFINSNDTIFSSSLEKSNATWKSMIITGHDAARLKPLWRSLYNKLWSKVARNLLSYGSSLLHGGQSLEKFQSTLANTSCHIGKMGLWWCLISI